MQDYDQVRIDVIMGSIRVSMQQAVAEFFETKSVEFQGLIDQTITEYDWNEAVKREIDAALSAQARSFVENSLQCVSKDWEGYKKVQREADELVRLRLAELYLKDKRKS
jgi:hypothetical protein